MSLKPQYHGTPSVSVSYGSVDAGLFPQEGNEIQYASLDRAREIVVKMPENARKILLAPLEEGLIDAQSVFYLIDDYIDGQIAISVQDFIDLAARHSSQTSQQSATYEQGHFDENKKPAREEEIFARLHQSSVTSFPNDQCISKSRHGTHSSVDGNGKDGTVVPPRLLNALLRIANGKMTNNGTSVPETKIQSHSIHKVESGAYMTCKSQWKFLAWRVNCSKKRQRCLISAGIVVFILCCLAIGGALFIVLQENPVVIPITVYQPPDNYTVRCMKALHDTTSYCTDMTSTGFGCVNGCRLDGISEGCGWFLIHENYFKECTLQDSGITQDWRSCSLDYDCSIRCVTQYYRLYKENCPGTMSECECLVRNHIGGPTGWNKTTTIENWEKVREKLNEVRMSV